MTHFAGYRLAEPVISDSDAAVPGSAAVKRHRGQRLSRTAGSVVLVAAVCSLAVAPAASADAGATVKAQTQRMSDANLGSQQDGSYNAGDQLTLVCSKRGQGVKGFFSFNIPGGWDNLWYKTSDGHFVADVDIETGTLDVVAPDCGGGGGSTPPPTSSPAAGYDRAAAQGWALNNVNAKERYTEDDCTWYVSQALWNGGLPKTADWTDATADKGKQASKWDIVGPTKTATQPDYMKNYLVNSGSASIRELDWRVNDVPDAQIGDLIGYDWNGRPDGTIDHIMIITGFSGGYPLVSGHSRATANQGWTWSELKNGWIEQVYATPGGDAPRVYLLHIN